MECVSAWHCGGTQIILGIHPIIYSHYVIIIGNNIFTQLLLTKPHYIAAATLCILHYVAAIYNLPVRPVMTFLYYWHALPTVVTPSCSPESTNKLIQKEICEGERTQRGEMSAPGVNA